MNKEKYPKGPIIKRPLINLLSFRKNPLEYLKNLEKEYGAVSSFKLGKQDLILVKSPEMIKDILVTNQNKFIKGRALEQAKALLGEGLLTSENDIHKKQRRMIQPAFNHSRILHYGEIMTNATQEYIKNWGNNTLKDISIEMTNLTLDIVCRTLFDTKIENNSQIKESLEISLKMFMDLTNPISTLLKNIPTPKKMKFKKASKFFDELINKMIEERRKDKEEKNDLLSILVNAQDEEDNQKKMNNKQLKDEILTLFLAGHETTSNLLTWTFYLLSQNPTIEEKLQEELKEKLNGDIPNTKNVQDLHYAKKIIYEVMRIYPPAWTIGRRNTEKYSFDEFEFEPYTVFLISQFISHRNEKYFPEPEKFDPDRWTDEFKNNIPKFAYFPFGGGNRICIGEHFAIMEAIIILASVYQKFKLRLDKNQKVELEPLITLRPKYGMKMFVSKI
jgi:cytochrome P450